MGAKCPHFFLRGDIMDEQQANLIIVSSKLESLEERFNHHSQKIELKIDQLVKAITSVLVLQEREAQNAQAILNLKSEFKELRSEEQKVAKELDDKIKKCIEESIHAELNLAKKVDDLNTKLLEVDYEQKKWLNRAAGGFLVAGILIGIIQFMGYGYIEKISAEYSQLVDTINSTNKQIADLTSKGGN